MTTPPSTVPLWARFEHRLRSDVWYENPPQDASLAVTFTAPSGTRHVVDAFWDGGAMWAVRFCPGETGEWTYATDCSDASNGSLHAVKGTFRCTPAAGTSRFEAHGPVRASDDRRHLAHADGTPFFWLADTAWNGPLLSTDAEWDHYLHIRAAQRFTAVQWVATHWRASPGGDRNGATAFDGVERIHISPSFFRRLDGKVDAVNRAGLVAAPVMLWENSEDSAFPDSNPGHTLPEDQAILLGRYMLARWGANAVVWILMGDWRYQPHNAERWRRIGRGIFAGRPHGPVATHVRSRVFLADEFRDEEWLDVVGYQTGHSDEESFLHWIHSGDIARDWEKGRARVIMNLEPNYEDHISRHSANRFDAYAVRRACYWSLLNAPTAGVTYGAHGVWGWDDGTRPPVDHPHTGIPRHWRDALHLPGGAQMAHLADLFTSIEWWRLRPAPGLLAAQPGEASARRHISASMTRAGDLAVVYSPGGAAVHLRAAA
ncbi:MAG: DUF4038 domain-containing protein, partial [Gemmatimonadetes bacterium]|nr:DUF4038 domain-containing protein [Gemmatimonadota bacterium]